MSDSVKSRRFVYCGNRGFVLQEMRAAGFNIGAIGAVAGSYLERQLQGEGIDYFPIANRASFHAWLRNLPFDVFVSNGCPYRVLVNEFPAKRLFVNVHPSLLPDLRGADPVPGALLFRRDAGATCHLMDQDFDTGPIISQVRIPYTHDLDAALLYQLSFLAERKVFRAAIARNFLPIGPQESLSENIYYSRRPEDNDVDLGATAEAIIDKVRAFGNRSQGARIRHGNHIMRVFGAMLLENPFLNEYRQDYAENEVVLNYESNLVIRKGNGFLKLGPIEGATDAIRCGIILGDVNAVA